MNVSDRVETLEVGSFGARHIRAVSTVRQLLKGMIYFFYSRTRLSACTECVVCVGFLCVVRRKVVRSLCKCTLIV